VLMFALSQQPIAVSSKLDSPHRLMNKQTDKCWLVTTLG